MQDYSRKEHRVHEFPSIGLSSTLWISNSAFSSTNTLLQACLMLHF